MDREFRSLFSALHLSGCAKRPVVAGIYVIREGQTQPSFEMAANSCSWQEGVTSCPRVGMAPGAGYDLCTAQHAEASLVKQLQASGLKPAMPIAWVVGHYYACEPCATALKKFGIQEIRVREWPGEASRDRLEMLEETVNHLYQVLAEAKRSHVVLTIGLKNLPDRPERPLGAGC